MSPKLINNAVTLARAFVIFFKVSFINNQAADGFKPFAAYVFLKSTLTGVSEDDTIATIEAACAEYHQTGKCCMGSST